MTPPAYPRAAYIHVPFCRHRCGYCNFTLVAGRDDLIADYLRALRRELSWLETPRPVDTLFLGGGTPTHLAETDLQQLLELARYWFPLAPGHEFSIEANPADLTPAKARVLREHHVTRVSLGAQSFAEGKLRLLERDHDATMVRRGVELVREWVEVVALDLIFGSPGETLEQWRADLEAAIELRPEHVSTYGLTFERGARFWSRLSRGELRPVGEDLERRMYLMAIDRLQAAGLEHYEVSNFARPGRRCRHNETYWTGGAYYAAGPGAARFVDGRRETNHRSTTTYLRRVLRGESPVAESERLDPEMAARERLVFGLRRLEGVRLEEFQTETGFAASDLVGPALDRFVERGFLIRESGSLRLTSDGLLVSDSIWPEFL